MRIMRIRSFDQQRIETLVSTTPAQGIEWLEIWKQESKKEESKIKQL